MQTLYFRITEAEWIARGIGFDLNSDKDQYYWFIKSCLLSPLPLNWDREVNEQQETIYRNKLNGVITTEHPKLYEFRKEFDEVLKIKKEENY